MGNAVTNTMSSTLADNSSTPLRLSPVHDALSHLNPRWSEMRGMPVAMDFGSPAQELANSAELGLCDVSFLPRMVLKGSEAASFLSSQNVAVPSQTLGVTKLDAGGLVVRSGSAEFLVEDGPQTNVVERLQAALGAGRAGCYSVLRQDASFLLSGKRAAEVFLETCGYDFRQPPETLVMTRVAGVSCSIVHRTFNQTGAFQLWLDPSYGEYLWETLLEVVRDLRGDAVGASALI